MAGPNLQDRWKSRSVHVTGANSASASRRRRSLSNTPEKSALSLADILSHEVPAGSIIGPNKGCGGWGYPEINRVGRRVKEGAEEMIRFTNREIEKAKGG